MIAFGPFTLDEETRQVWHGDRRSPLRAKSFAVLRELVRRRGRLVTKEHLFTACWPKTAVSQTVLRVCIREIRTMLAEDTTAATSIESVGRRGYRLLAGSGDADVPADPPIGRERELDALRRALERANAGVRQMVFVSGEPGLGKTTLLDHFAEATRGTSGARVGWGQCVELTGGAEPYLPILDLLDRLSAEDANGVVAAALERWAPSWLLHMPALVDGARAAALARRVLGGNGNRMLRELAEALEALAAEETLVLVLEDLHWSDVASVDVLAYLAQRTGPARLLVVGSYRTGDLRDGPLQGIAQGLVAHRRAAEIPLGRLTRRDVETYLVRRLTGSLVAGDLGEVLHARTRGNPLFLTATVDYLLERGILAELHGRWSLTGPLAGIAPDSVRELARQQIDRLDARERRVLDAACITGFEFTAASAAAASDMAAADVEDVCARLAARDELVSATGVAAWPDGTMSGRYEFRHALYREVLESALAPARRRLQHQAVGERLEAAWGARSAEIATELAVHFAAAADGERAIRYHQAAAMAARARFAEREAIVHLHAALEHLRERPETIARAQTELLCLLDLGGALFAIRGAASDEALEAHRRALALAERLGAPEACFRAQIGLHTGAVVRAELHRARAVAKDLRATAARVGKPFFAFIGHVSTGYTLVHLGEFVGSQRHLAQAHALWREDFPSLTVDSSMVTRAMLGFTALIQGDHRTGSRWIRDSLAHADARQSPYNMAYASSLAGQYQATAGQRDLALEHATRAASLARQHGFVTHGAVAMVVRGWALREVEALREGISQYEGAGAYVATSLFRGLLAEVLLDLGRIDAAKAELAAAFAFVERSGERRHLAELYRLEGECRRRDGAGISASSGIDVRACFDQALTIARRQKARLWELRAAISAAEFLASEGARRDARQLLQASLRVFATDEESPDLLRARALRLRV